MLDKTEQSDQASSRNEKPDSCYCSARPNGSGPCLSCYTRWLASRRSKEVMAEDWDWLADQQESAPRICVRKNRLWRKTTCSSGRRPYWNDDDFDVVANDEVVGRIFKAGVSVASPWMCYRRPFRLETTAAANCLIASSTKAGHATVSGYDRPNDGG